MSLIAVDPSLTCSGIALFRDSQTIIGTIIIKPKTQDNDRFKEIAIKFKMLLEKYKPDILVLETQYIPNKNMFTDSILKVARVSGIFEGVFLAYNPLGRVVFVNPMSAQSAMGITRKLSRDEKKLAMLKMVSLMFPVLAGITNDEADAVGLGVAAYCKL